MLQWEKSSSPPLKAMLNLRGKFAKRGLPNVPSGERISMSFISVVRGMVLRISVGEIPARGEPTMLRTLSRAEWKEVWFRAWRPAMMVEAAGTCLGWVG